MDRRILYLVAVAMAALFVSSSPASESTWRDPKSGRDYAYVDGSRSYSEAESLCRARGMAVFNFAYLSQEERNAWTESELAREIVEKNGLVSPTGHPYARVWSSSRHVSHANEHPRSEASVLILRQKDGKMRRPVAELARFSEPAVAVCMSAEDDVWYQCTCELRCHYTLRIHTSTFYDYFAHALTEEGATEALATERIVQRSQDPNWSRKEGYPCSLHLPSMTCSRVLW